MIRPKILLLPSWYPSKVHDTNGIFIRRFAESIGDKVEVKILYAVSSESSTKIELEINNQVGFQEYFVYYPKIKAGLFSSFYKLKAFYQAYNYGFNKMKADGFIPEVVHVQVALNAGLFALELKKKFNLPFIVTEHWSGYLKEDGRYQGFLNKLTARKIFKNANAVVTVSSALGESLVKHQLIKSFYVVPNALQSEKFFPINNTIQPQGFIHISNFAKEKQVSKIIKAFQALLESGIKTKLILVGEGYEKQALQNLCLNNSLLADTVEFLPFQTPEQLNLLINKSYALVLFSAFETMSLVMAETWLCGKPVIVTKVGGIPENFNSKAGIMIEPDNEPQLFEAMKNIYLNHTQYEPAICRAHSISKFSKEKIINDYLSLYLPLISR